MPGVASLHVHHCRQSIYRKPALMLALELPLAGDENPHCVAVVGLLQRQDVKQIGEAAVAFAQHAQAFGGDFGDQAHVATFHVRLEHVSDIEIGLAGDASVIKTQQIIEEQQVAFLVRLFQNRQQTVFPLPDVGHSGDEPLRRNQERQLLEFLPVVALLHRPVDVFVKRRRFADLRRAEQQNRALVRCVQKPG